MTHPTATQQVSELAIDRTGIRDPLTNPTDKGGHFAAWEQPELVVGDLRTGFESLR